MLAPFNLNRYLTFVLMVTLPVIFTDRNIGKYLSDPGYLMGYILGIIIFGLVLGLFMETIVRWMLREGKATKIESVTWNKDEKDGKQSEQVEETYKDKAYAYEEKNYKQLKGNLRGGKAFFYFSLGLTYILSFVQYMQEPSKAYLLVSFVYIIYFISVSIIYLIYYFSLRQLETFQIRNSLLLLALADVVFIGLVLLDIVRPGLGIAIINIYILKMVADIYQLRKIQKYNLEKYSLEPKFNLSN